MNEEQKKKTSARTEKGLYIVLFVCVAIVGIASWTLLYHQLNTPEPAETMSYSSPSAEKTAEEPDYSDIIRSPRTELKPENEYPPEEQETMAEIPEAPEEEAEKLTESAETPEVEETAVPAPPPVKTEEKTIRFIWPLAGNIEMAYAMEELIYDKTMADWRTHDGIDIEARLGSKVFAIADGTVESVYNDDMYGTTVVISHSGGLESIYSNLAGQPVVAQGDTVSFGDVIGSVGDTAAAETNEVSHLHFAMKRDGASIDPAEILPKR